jgi:transposase
VVVAVDQFTKRIGTVQRRGWFRIGSEPTVKVTNSWEKVTVLGALTHEGESFYCWTEDNLTRRHGIQFLKALLDEFGDNLVVFLDRAGYFFAKDVREFVSGSTDTGTIGDTSITCVRGDKLDLWYFPPKLPELNPVEGCWNQLQEWFNHRFVEDLTQLKQNLAEGIQEITMPNIWNYLCE